MILFPPHGHSYAGAVVYETIDGDDPDIGAYETVDNVQGHGVALGSAPVTRENVAYGVTYPVSTTPNPAYVDNVQGDSAPVTRENVAYGVTYPVSTTPNPAYVDNVQGDSAPVTRENVAYGVTYPVSTTINPAYMAVNSI